MLTALLSQITAIACTYLSCELLGLSQLRFLALASFSNSASCVVGSMISTSALTTLCLVGLRLLV